MGKEEEAAAAAAARPSKKTAGGEAATAEAARPSKKARRAAAAAAAASGLTSFALRLAKCLADTSADGGGQKNVVFSPASIYAALALLAAGARGTTRDEVLDVLGAASRREVAEFVRGVAERALAGSRCRSVESGAPLVAFACALWHDERLALKPAYSKAAVESYKAETHAADFVHKAEEAREEINSWVSKASKGLITSILPQGSVNPLTGLVLANAIYFKGRWSMPFADKDTETRRFRLLDGSHVRTPFMRGRQDHAVAHYDGFKVLKLAYHPYRLPHRQDAYLGGGSKEEQDGRRARFSMCIFLPDDHDGLPSLVDKMASCGPSFLWDHMPSKRGEVDELLLPKFKLSFSSRINGVLQAMGIKAAFDERTADLTDMLEGKVRLVLEHVFHKAVIEVNEEGTKAAASSACVLRLICDSLSPPVNFVADHPFAFFVVEEVSGVIVFMGQVLDPTKPE